MRIEIIIAFLFLFAYGASLAGFALTYGGYTNAEVGTLGGLITGLFFYGLIGAKGIARWPVFGFVVCMILLWVGFFFLGQSDPTNMQWYTFLSANKNPVAKGQPAPVTTPLLKSDTSMYVGSLIIAISGIILIFSGLGMWGLVSLEPDEVDPNAPAAAAPATPPSVPKPIAAPKPVVVPAVAPPVATHYP